MLRQLSLASGLFIVLSSTAHAATYVVTRFDDPLPGACLIGDCSLREAVIAANATWVADTIQLANGSYLLTRTTGSEAQSFDLDVNRTLTITAPSGKALVFNAIGSVGAESRVIDAVNVRLTLNGVSLRDGDVGTGQGGCMRATSSRISFNTGTMALCTAKDGSGLLALDSDVFLNQAVIYRNSGSGVALSASTLNLVASTISQNVGDRGGGVYIFGSVGSAIIGDGLSAIKENQASMGGGVMIEWGSNSEIVGPAGGWLQIADNSAVLGGGLLSGMGSLLMRNVAVTGNVAQDIGGGMHTHSLDLRRVHIAGNVAYVAGGAYVGCAGVQWPCRIEETSFVSNHAEQDGGALLHSSGGVLDIVNVSSYGNSANRGGGIAAWGTVRLTHFTSYMDTATLGNSLIHVGTGGTGQASLMRNSALLSGCATTGGSVLISEGGNAQVSGTSSCSLTHASDLPAITSAQAGASFGDFGGGMPVVGIAATSILVNAGFPSWCTPKDVRGLVRPASCDIGAFEVGAGAP